MYCRYCGKQLSDEAIMCPECGTPTKTIARTPTVENEKTPTPEVQNVPNHQLGVVGFFLSTFAFVTSIIFGAFMYVYYGATLLLYVIGYTSILPALAGISIGISTVKNEKGAKKMLAITGIILAGIALLFLFLTACIMCAAL